MGDFAELLLIRQIPSSTGRSQFADRNNIEKLLKMLQFVNSSSTIINARYVYRTLNFCNTAIAAAFEVLTWMPD